MTDRKDTPAVLAATTVALTFSATTALFPSAIAPEIAAGLGVSPSLIGVQVSVLYLGAMISSLLGGGISRRLGACRTTQWAVMIFGLGGLLAAAPNGLAFMLASLMIGLGYGLTNPAASHLLVRFTNPARRGLVFSIKQTGVPLGGVIAGAAAPLLAVNYGWQAAMAALAVPAILGLIALQQRRNHWDDDRDPAAQWIASPLSDIRLVWETPALRWTALASFFFSATQLCLTVFTVTLLVEDLNIALVTAGLVMAAVQICGVGGRVLWGWAADRLANGSLTLLVINSLAVLLALIVALMQPDWPLIVVAAVLCVFGGLALGWNGVYLAEIARNAPSGHVARASGGSLFITFSGVLIGPAAFTGLHLLTQSYSQTFFAVAACSLIGVILLIAARRSQRQPIAEK